MTTFRAHFGMVDGCWITASTDHETYACEDYDHRVYFDDWKEWMTKKPTCVITTWDSMRQEYHLYRNNEQVDATPFDIGRPWHPQPTATELKTLPEWAVEALIELGEVSRAI